MREETNKKELIIESGIVGVMRAESSEKLLNAARALKSGGVNCIEVAMTTPNALSVIEEVTAELEEVLIGAGTVLDAETARSAILAGAEYLVSPATDVAMIKMAKRYDKLVAPGAFTPTEILKAWEAGADLVKVFPASRLGPKYISAVKAPLPQVSLMPTGGVSQDNAAEFVEAGAEVLCAGSALVETQALQEGNFAKIEENAEKLVEEVRMGRSRR